MSLVSSKLERSREYESVRDKEIFEILSEKNEISYTQIDNLKTTFDKVELQLDKFEQLDSIKHFRKDHPFNIDFNHLKMINDTKIKLFSRRKKLLKEEILKTEKTQKYKIENIQIEN